MIVRSVACTASISMPRKRSVSTKCEPTAPQIPPPCSASLHQFHSRVRSPRLGTRVAHLDVPDPAKLADPLARGAEGGEEAQLVIDQRDLIGMLRVAAATSCSASDAFSAVGFSQSTCLPASSADVAISQMFRRRRDDRDEIDVRGDQWRQSSNGSTSSSLGDLARAFGVVSGDGDDFEARFAERRHLHARAPAGADDSYARHVAIMSLPPPSACPVRRTARPGRAARRRGTASPESRPASAPRRVGSSLYAEMMMTGDSLRRAAEPAQPLAAVHARHGQVEDDQQDVGVLLDDGDRVLRRRAR